MDGYFRGDYDTDLLSYGLSSPRAQPMVEDLTETPASRVGARSTGNFSELSGAGDFESAASRRSPNFSTRLEDDTYDVDDTYDPGQFNKILKRQRDLSLFMEYLRPRIVGLNKSTFRDANLAFQQVESLELDVGNLKRLFGDTRRKCVCRCWSVVDDGPVAQIVVAVLRL